MSSCFWFVTFLKITPRMSFPISKRLTFLDYFSYMQFSRYMYYGLHLECPMGLNGLEPPTSRLSGVRSNQLSYKPTMEMKRFELSTPCLQGRCSPNWATSPWIQHPPALPHRLQCSTIGRSGLNRRVRDGNGCVPRAHRRWKYLVIVLITQQ